MNYKLIWFGTMRQEIEEGAPSLLQALLDGWEIVRCDTTSNCVIYLLKKIK